MSVTLQLGGGCQKTPNGIVNTGTDTILSYMALFALLNGTKQGARGHSVLASEFRAGKEAWNAVYDLFSETAAAMPGMSSTAPIRKRDPEVDELLFAGVPVLYDVTMPADAIVAWHKGVMHDTELGRLCGVER